MFCLSRRRVIAAGVTLFAIALLPLPLVSAEERERTNTVMTVSEMCGGCVKKITKRFEGVESIAKVECSIEKRSVTVIPKADVRLSPKGIWEIMESINKTPTKMVTPDGTFTSKPNEQRAQS